MAEKLEVLFPEGDDTGAFIVPVLDARSQVLSIKDGRNGVGKPVFKLAPLGSGQLFALIAPDLGVPGEVLQQVISQANTASDGHPFASPLIRRLAGRGSFFRGFHFR